MSLAEGESKGLGAAPSIVGAADRRRIIRREPLDHVRELQRQARPWRRSSLTKQPVIVCCVRPVSRLERWCRQTSGCGWSSNQPFQRRPLRWPDPSPSEQQADHAERRRDQSRPATTPVDQGGPENTHPSQDSEGSLGDRFPGGRGSPCGSGCAGFSGCR